MRRREIHGVVSAEQWKQVGEDDLARRSGLKEEDVRGSLLVALSGVLVLAMLVTGPMWTAIRFWSSKDGHGPQFEQLWLLPFSLTLAAIVPLAFALRRERSLGRFALAAFLAISLAIELATFPWF